MTIQNEIVNRGIRHAVYFQQVSNREVALMVKFLEEKLLPDLKETLRRRLERGAFNNRIDSPTTRRYQKLIRDLEAKIASGMKELNIESVRRLRKLGMLEANWASQSLAQTMPFDITFNSISLPTVNSIIKSKPFEGQFLKDWYSGLGKRTSQRVAKELSIGLASGESPEKITRRLMGARDGRFAGRGPLGGELRRNVRTIVRTAANHVAAHAREAVYEANKDVIEKVRWLSVLDHRTSDFCMSEDGQEYKINEGPRPPAHHQCRSTTIPVTKSWKDLKIGKGGQEIRIGGRAYRSYGPDLKSSFTRVSADGDLTYGTWLKSQPYHVQKAVLGTTRARLFRDGEISFDRFFDSGKMISLRRLARLENISL
tara:strand:+ start:6172 stop:7281 length:1110 start_codon:yes stop_codon:yes gene_type:complete